MNKEEIIKSLNNKLEVQDITETITSIIYSREIKSILLLIQNLDKENINYKQALNEIRKILTDCKKLMPHEFDWEEQADNILQIIAKVLGDD